jgi:predicted Zn-dependent peptidase
MKVVFDKCGSKMSTIILTFNAGSDVEYKKWTAGIAHMVEHMVFQGSKDKTHSELMCAMATLGANWNAATWHEKVCYYVTVPAENTLAAAKLLDDMLFNRTFSQEAFEKEKLVVLEEERGCRDDVDYAIGDQLCKFLYKGPLSMSIIGTKNSIKSLTLKEISTFHKQYYNKNSLLLTVVGPQDLDFNNISNVFGKNNGKFIRNKIYKTVHTNTKKRIIQDKRVNQPTIYISYKSFPVGNKLSLPLSYFSKFFSEGMDSRLFEKIRQQLGLCYYVGSFIETQENLGFYIISTKVAKENIDKALFSIDKEIKSVIKDGFTEEEMLRAKNKYLSDIYGYIETSYGLANILSSRATLRLNDINTLIKRIKNMKSNDIKKAIEKTFKSENKQVFIYRGK